MKKILLLLLLATFSMQAQTLQNPTYGNVKLKNNQTSTTATKVNVQENDGTINTIPKSELVNVIEKDNAPELPVIGEVGKIYVVKNLNKIYRWNGTFYSELAFADISGKVDKVAGSGLVTDAEKTTWNAKQNALGFTPENVANKSDSYSVSSTATYPNTKALVDGLGTKISGTLTTNIIPKSFGTKSIGDSSINDNGITVTTNLPIHANSFVKSIGSTNLLLASGSDITQVSLPISTATQTALDLKANLASPSLTGTPTAPTAPAGTNTTQIASTAFVLANGNANGLLEFNSTDRTIWNNGKGNIDSNTTFGKSSLSATTTGNSNASFGFQSLSGITTGSNNVGFGVNALGNNQTGSRNVAIGRESGFYVTASSQANTQSNDCVFIGDLTQVGTQGSVNEIVIGSNAKGAGSNTATLGNASITNTILRGAVTTNGSFIKSSAPATNILLAGGGDIAQNTAFNKNFGTTAGTVVEGGTLGSNAYTSTAYLPLSGGALSGALTTVDNVYIGGNGNTNIQFLQNGVTKWIFGYVPVISAYRFSNGITDVLTLYNDGSSKFSGTVTATSYTATSLPVFENNAAASSLSVGQFYRTSTGVLMVKF